MDYFVRQDSIVRKIWGKSDTILFIFAGAAAEFALNKAVDWLYFTGRLPNDPLGRLISTVGYARKIVFSEYDAALQSIDQIAAIHAAVEEKRGAEIPDWAYRDVLFMLIDYSIRAFEVMERELTEEEKAETFDVFYRVGLRMEINGLPNNLTEWKEMRQQHLEQNLAFGKLSADLFSQYRKHLGPVRYQLLRQAQTLVVPERVRELLGLKSVRIIKPLLQFYKLTRVLQIHRFVRNVIMPADYKKQISELDYNS